jgi:hypothetical protein
MLHTIAIPEISPLGGVDSSYTVFRGLDPGTQVKLHLYKARTLWNRYRSGSWGGAAMKFPDDHKKLLDKREKKETKLTDADPAAWKHFYHALSIIMHYNPPAEHWDLLIASDGVPYGSMAFFTPVEMSCLMEFVQVAAEVDPTLLQREPILSEMKTWERVVYTEILKSISYGMKQVDDVASHYKEVILDTPGWKSVVRKFLVDLRYVWERLPNAQQIRGSPAAVEIINEGAKENIRALLSY